VKDLVCRFVTDWSTVPGRYRKEGEVVNSDSPPRNRIRNQQGGIATMALRDSEPTAKTLLHHLQAFRAGDVEAIMSTYTEDAVLITPDGVVKGQAQIQSLFVQMFTNMFPPDKTSLNVAKQVVDGEIAYLLWSGSSPYYNIPFATDTFVIRDRKIVAQTFAPQVESK
jgi:hypothetical protein